MQNLKFEFTPKNQSTPKLPKDDLFKSLIFNVSPFMGGAKKTLNINIKHFSE